MSQCLIVNGPGKFELMMSVFGSPNHSANPQASVMIDFIMDDGKKMRIGMRVNMVEREDGSGESWNIEGYATSWQGPDELTKVLKAKQTVRGYFRTDRRTGHLFLG